MLTYKGNVYLEERSFYPKGAMNTIESIVAMVG